MSVHDQVIHTNTPISFWQQSRLRRSCWFPVVPKVDLHVLPSFAVLCQSTNFVRKGGEGGGGFSTHVGGSNGVNTRPMPPTLPKQQQPYLEPRSFLKARHWVRVFSNQRRVNILTFQYYSRCWNPTSEVIQFTLFCFFPPIPDILLASLLRASQGSAINVFLVQSV